MTDLVSILIVEDEPAIFELIKHTLTKKKPPGWPFRYKVIQAGTLPEALKAVDRIAWDVIILDLGMPPESSGIDTFWKMYEATKAPIIVLTGADSGGLFEEILADGAYRCYAKTEIAPCLPMLHYTIRHVLYEHADKKLIKQQAETITGRLKPLIRVCAGCDRYYDEIQKRWVSRTIYYRRRKFIESHGHCDDCHRDFYSKDLRDAVKEYE